MSSVEQLNYVPTIYDKNSPNLPQEFYGSVLNARGKPTEAFKRMVDAVFFFIVDNHPVLEENKVEYIDHKMYTGFLSYHGLRPQSEIRLIYTFPKPYYDAASAPSTLTVSVVSDELSPVLDRLGWLHLHVFEVKAFPDAAFRFWQRAMVLLGLRDPATGQGFPKPLPRTVFPESPDPYSLNSYETWKSDATTRILTDPNYSYAAIQQRETKPIELSGTPAARQHALYGVMGASEHKGKGVAKLSGPDEREYDTLSKLPAQLGNMNLTAGGSSHPRRASSLDDHGPGPSTQNRPRASSDGKRDGARVPAQQRTANPDHGE